MGDCRAEKPWAQALKPDFLGANSGYHLPAVELGKFSLCLNVYIGAVWELLSNNAQNKIAFFLTYF